jgi:hypothetical protein
VTVCRVIPLIACGLAVALWTQSPVGAAQRSLPDFTAELHVIDLNKGELYSSTVAIGKYGSRNEIRHSQYGKMIAIANYKQQQCRTYLVDKKAFYIEKLEPKAPDCDLDLDRLFGEYAATINTDSYNALGATQPCSGYKGKKILEDSFDGRNVEKWICVNTNSSQTFTQLFDPKLGRVIKHEEGNLTKEYRHIVIKRLARSLFSPLTGYKEYSQQEFYKLLRIPEFNVPAAGSGQPAVDMNKLLPNDRLQVCMEQCQSTADACNKSAKGEAGIKQCDNAFERCAADCEQRYPPQ